MMLEATARPAFCATFQCSMRVSAPSPPGPWYGYVAMSPIAKTSERPSTAKCSLVFREPSFSRVMASLAFKNVVAGVTPVPRITTEEC